MMQNTTSNRTGTFTLWATRAGPSNGHHYSFFSLPFCRFISDGDAYDRVARSRPPPTLGELMGGRSWEPYASVRATPGLSPRRDECATPELTAEQAERLSRAAEDRWFFELYLNDLPMWAPIGIGGEGVNGSSPARVYTEYRHSVLLSGSGPDLEPMSAFVVPVADSAVPIEAGRSYTFRMTTKFMMHTRVQVGPSGTTPLAIGEGKFDQYVDEAFVERMLPFQEMTARNNFGVVMMSAAFFFAVMRTIWKHNSSSNEEETGKADAERGDTPLLVNTDGETKLDPTSVYSHLNDAEVLGALIGNGWHLLAWAFAMAFWFKDVNPLEYGPGGQTGQMIYGYAATSIVGGYTSSLYIRKQNRFFGSFGEGKRGHCWKRTAALTVALVPLLLSLILAIYAIAAVPTRTIDIVSIQGVFRVLLLWLVGAAASMAGASLGQWQRASRGGSPPGFVSPLSYPPPKKQSSLGFIVRFEERHRPRVVYLLRKRFLCLAAFVGWIQFMFIIWEYRLFLMMSTGVYRFAYKVSWATFFNLTMMVLSTLLSSTLTIIAMFHQGKKQSTPWQWRSFFISACAGGISFVDSIYMFRRFDLVGAPSIIHYGGVSLLVGTGIALINGAVSHFVTSTALWLLFSNSKAD